MLLKLYTRVLEKEKHISKINSSACEALTLLFRNEDYGHWPHSKYIAVRILKSLYFNSLALENKLIMSMKNPVIGETIMYNALSEYFLNFVWCFNVNIFNPYMLISDEVAITSPIIIILVYFWNHQNILQKLALFTRLRGAICAIPFNCLRQELHFLHRFTFTTSRSSLNTQVTGQRKSQTSQKVVFYIIFAGMWFHSIET